MALLRRTPLVRTTVDLGPSGVVAVMLEPAPGRWPDREAVDRLVVPAGIAALALARAGETVFDRVHQQLRNTATPVATLRSDDPSERVAMVAGLRLVPEVAEAELRIAVQR